MKTTFLAAILALVFAYLAGGAPADYWVVSREMIKDVKEAPLSISVNGSLSDDPARMTVLLKDVFYAGKDALLVVCYYNQPASENSYWLRSEKVGWAHFRNIYAIEDRNIVEHGVKVIGSAEAGDTTVAGTKGLILVNGHLVRIRDGRITFGGQPATYAPVYGVFSAPITSVAEAIQEMLGIPEDRWRPGYETTMRIVVADTVINRPGFKTLDFGGAKNVELIHINADGTVNEVNKSLPESWRGILRTPVTPQMERVVTATSGNYLPQPDSRNGRAEVPDPNAAAPRTIDWWLWQVILADC